MTVLTEAERAAPHRVAARLRIQNAAGFLEAAAAMFTAGKVDLHPFAFFVNMCFAYELSLKAFLAHRKWQGKEGRGGLGHDLEQAFAEAVTLGYVPPSDVSDMLKILGPLSKAPMELRYLTGNAVQLPHPPEHALAVAHAHMNAVARQLPISDIR